MTNPIAESLPYDSPLPDDTQPAWHAVVRLLIPHTDRHGNAVDTQAAAEDYVAETLRGEFLDWGYARAIDPETGEAVPGEEGMQTPLRITVWKPYVEGTWDEEAQEQA